MFWRSSLQLAFVIVLFYRLHYRATIALFDNRLLSGIQKPASVRGFNTGLYL